MGTRTMVAPTGSVASSMLLVLSSNRMLSVGAAVWVLTAEGSLNLFFFFLRSALHCQI